MEFAQAKKTLAHFTDCLLPECTDKRFLSSPRSYRHIGVAALRAKILSDEAEDEGFGHSKARTTTKYDEIFAATLRAGANFTDFVVARR